MKKQITVSICGIALVVVTTMLWLRVRSLETTVNTLNQRLQSNPTVVTVGQTKTNKDSAQQPVFKLIESAKHNEYTTNIGVPWDVERAMMSGAHENDTTRDTMQGEPIQIEVSPTTPTNDSTSPPKMNLDFLDRDTGPN